MSETPDIEKRLEALETGNSSANPKKKSAIPIVAGVAVILAAGASALVLSQDEAEEPMPTAIADEFQPVGEGFGEIEPFRPPAPPEPEVVLVEAEAEPNSELLAQLEAMRSQIEALQNQPEPEAPDNSAVTDALTALNSQLVAMQETSEESQRLMQDQLAERDAAIERLRLDLDLAQLNQPAPAPVDLGPTDEEQRRLAELERRRQQEAAFQEARIASPMIAFGASSGGSQESALGDRTFGEIADFVMNGALPSEVTQAEVIANPGNTVVQGTMIQAVTETALDSSLPGQIRAIVSEDVHAYDGSRVLISRGSRLIGRYRSGLDVAQQRVTIAWDRIILPNNQSVQISAFGGDELGRSGVTGFVDTRFDERFGSAALISLISALPGAAAAQVDDETGADVLEDVGDDLGDATESVIGEYLAIGPVIYVDQGSRITVMVNGDLEIF